MVTRGRRGGGPYAAAHRVRSPGGDHETQVSRFWVTHRHAVDVERLCSLLPRRLLRAAARALPRAVPSQVEWERQWNGMWLALQLVRRGRGPGHGDDGWPHDGWSDAHGSGCAG